MESFKEIIKRNDKTKARRYCFAVTENLAASANSLGPLFFLFFDDDNQHDDDDDDDDDGDLTDTMHRFPFVFCPDCSLFSI